VALGDDVSGSFKYNPGLCTDHHKFAVDVDYGDGQGWQTLVEFVPGVDFTPLSDAWIIGTIPRFRVINTTTQVRFRMVAITMWAGGDIIYFDSIDAEVHVLDKSTADDFMDNLAVEIAAVDPNIGSVFKTKKKWKKVADLNGDAGLTISLDGLFDTSRSGSNVTRFWMMDPVIKPRPFTTASYEFETIITITGFFQREDDDTQEEALFKAGMEILNRLCSKTVELTNLHTGDGYMGYLEDPPRILTAVVNAQLDDSGILGHAIQLEVTFFEEVDR
jgi:hypothetical protein